ncbi:hypothetical protein K3179_03405 [Qipengyuania sp. GH38]|uniref:hypothetical protein n=1 Tax=Qipengyuania intermedia TaxID=2867244 RepID=UPI001C8703D6|nr:hypothetical protein [Qipengyuania intermedia]MBX7513588.1 hypothetical protein [Qipengyuania intermedia]
MSRFLLQVALILLVVLFALRKGGRPERHIALVLLGMLAANTLYGVLVGWWTDYDEIPWYRVVFDCTGFALILIVALRADRWWPLWVSGVQLLSVLAHLLRALDADLHPLVYAIMERWPYWIAIGLTGLGTYLHASRARTASTD